MTDAQYYQIPYRTQVYNKDVLFIVMGRSPLCLRCNQVGHHRATCTTDLQKKKSAEAADNKNEETDKEAEQRNDHGDIV